MMKKIMTGLLALGLTMLSITNADLDVKISIAVRGDFQLFNPFSTNAPPSNLFPYDNGLAKMLPPRFMLPGTVGTKAIPTNNWWGNMIAASTEPQVEPVWSNPYAVRALLAAAPYGLALSYPYSTRTFAGSSGNGNAKQSYYHTVLDDFIFSASEFCDTPKYEVLAWDDLGVTVRLSSSPINKIESTLVSGMAFMTAKYSLLTPKFDMDHTILTINDADVESGSVVSDTRFVVKLDNDQTWVIYTPVPMTLTMNNSSSLVASAPYIGYVRTALVASGAALAALDKTKWCLLEGGDVEARDTSMYSFNFKTSGDCSAGLFHYLQVHHMDSLDRSSAEEVSGAKTIAATRGPMTGVITKTHPPLLRFTETTDVEVDFYPPRRPTPDVVQAQKIKQTLINDITNTTWSLPLNGSYYFNGKAAQKYANLCLMANDEIVTGSDKATLLRMCLDQLETVLEPFLTNSWEYPLHYDTVYRGIISSQGIALNNTFVDFGNTMYNDHHFHYGYWITTVAIVNFLDPSWSKLEELNRVAKFLVRDVANPSCSDPYFPKFRNFDWFRGHSFSHGVTPVADGKDQESTSEDINFHYGLTLFGKITGDTALMNIGHLMIKINAHAIQNYFLMTDDNRVHPPQIIPNKVTGIFFDNKVNYTTWFSPEKYAINGIQMIPITSVTEFVRTPTFVSEEWNTIISKIPDVVNTTVNNTWLSLLYANYATVNKEVALEKLQLVDMDNGLTRSWALYMAATRP